MTYPSRSGSGFASQPRVTFFARQGDGKTSRRINAAKTRQHQKKMKLDLLSIISLIDSPSISNEAYSIKWKNGDVNIFV